MIPIALGCFLVFRGYRLRPPFNAHLIPQTDAILVPAAILCLCGLGFCLWARAVLGRNWSGTVTLKENHELIVRGPYRLVRHPIYTAMLGKLIATGIVMTRWSVLIVAVAIFLVGTFIRIRFEERLLSEAFGERFAEWRSRVPGLIPFVKF